MSLGHELASGPAEGRIVDYPVVDTETHLILRCWPIETSPQMSPIDAITRTDHPGSLLVAEMDRSGVDAHLRGVRRARGPAHCARMCAFRTTCGHWCAREGAASLHAVKRLLLLVHIRPRAADYRVLGSSASRSPSPNRLNAITVMKIASPGTSMYSGSME